MVIPDTFGVRGERTIASYSFINIVEGTGIITYYLGTGLNDSATVTYTMQSTPFYSNDIEIEKTMAVTGGFELEAEVNYDMTVLNLPLTTKGTAMINISWAYKGYAAGISSAYLLIKLIKVSDGAETIIGTGKTNTFTGVGDEAYSAHKETKTLILDLTKTHLKKGDNFRLSIECWANGVGASGTAYVTWGQDPKNRDGTIFIPSTNDEITAMQINIPLEINL